MVVMYVMLNRRVSCTYSGIVCMGWSRLLIYIQATAVYTCKGLCLFPAEAKHLLLSFPL